MRWPLAAVVGASLALLLFWGLALLVAPPEAEIEVREMVMTMSTAAAVDSPAQSAATPAPAPSAPPPPQPAPSSPPPPAPLPDSPLTLPEPPDDPLPVRPEEVAELDSALPELIEAEPEPEPEPEPAPTPEPEPAPAPEPAPSPAAASPSATAAEASAQAAASGQGAPGTDDQASQAVQDVGQATPTRRVPPSYPRRAQRRGLEGHVVVEFLIRPDGRVKADSIRVVEARPRRVFDEAASRAVADWRFEADGRLRRARQRLEFDLR